jgi:GntR family transcriptional regulator, arabinose operon transcriptional repressor
MDRGGGPSEPRYGQVAERLRGEVVQGVYAPGSRLPAEVEMARSLGVSRGTLRHALRLLVSEGVLRTVPGRGTFVAEQDEGRRLPQAGLVAMVLPSIVRARAPELISGAEEVLRDSGYSLLLATSGDDRDLEREQVERAAAQGAAGLILYVVDGPMDLAGLRGLVAEGLPVVLIDRYVPDLAVDAVTMDNPSGAFLAVQHLVSLGRRRIGYIGTDNLGTSSIVERLAGYRWAMQAHGRQVDEDGLVCSALRRCLSWPLREADLPAARHNQEVLRRYLAGRRRPDAVYVCNDYLAFQVVEAAQALGLRVPEDLAVVGFDNVNSSDYAGPPLTTLEQPRLQIGRTAAALVLERLNGSRRQPRRINLATRLIVRQSSVAGATDPSTGGLAVPVPAT